VVTYWNREAASLYGFFSAEEAIGQPLRKLHAADLSEADYAGLLERIRAGRPTSSTTERRKKGGEIVRVSLKTTPLVDEQGALVGEITIARDVTAMFEKEEALRRAEQELRLHSQDSLPRFAVPLTPTEPTQIRRVLNKAPIRRSSGHSRQGDLPRPRIGRKAKRDGSDSCLVRLISTISRAAFNIWMGTGYGRRWPSPSCAIKRVCRSI
jgi:PAS domain S-box-containing protein